MAKSGRHWGWKLCSAGLLAMGGALAYFGDCVLAQITPDDTLGDESSVVAPNVNINGITTDRIDGGAKRGANLFHSFREFNIDEGLRVYFTNPTGIENILSRVTGNDPSDILGTLGVLGNANLFFINPNGIIFGSNASLDVGGSFVATTANAVRLGDTGVFSASEPATSNLLTVNPSALFFNALSGQAEVVNRSTAQSFFPINGNQLFNFGLEGNRLFTFGLEVPNGRSLLLVGGDVRVDGGVLLAPGGRVELGGVAGAGTVGLFVDGNSLRLSFPDDIARTDVSLTNGSRVDVIAEGGGSIAVNSRTLNISGGSSLVAGIGAGLGAVGTQAGNIEIDATDTVTIDGTSSTDSSSTIANGVLGAGNSGNIFINTGVLKVIGNAQIGSLTEGQGDTGNVTIRARDTVSFSGINSGVFNIVGELGVGNGAEINIQTRTLFLSSNAKLSTGTFGQGNSGNIQINASDSVFVSSGSFMQALTFGQGNAGNVTIQAGGTVSFDGISSNALPSGAYTLVGAAPGVVGDRKGGNINITAGSVSLTDGAQLSASTVGQGDAGSVTITATDTVSFDGVGSNGRSSAAGSTVEPGAVGNGGDINITTGSLSVTDGAVLSSSSEGSGAAGNIEVSASSIRLENLSFLSSDTVGGEGNINLRSQDLVLRRGSNITTDATGTATGGNITIDTGVIAALEDSDISANAQNAFGGRVIIDAQGIFGTEFRERENPATSDITASSNLGPQFSGTVEINTPDVDPSQGLATLPAELVDVSGLIAQGCPAGVRQGQSKFIITGRGGLPPTPREALSTNAVLVDWVTLNPEGENRSSPAASTNQARSVPAPIVEATGWVIGANGEVVLTARAPTVAPHSFWQTPSCLAPQSAPER